MLKALAEISPYTTPQDSRQILANVVQLLKVCMFKMTDKYVPCTLPMPIPIPHQ